MSRFFFHLRSLEGCEVDEIGGEFANVEAAYLDAYNAALEIAFEMLRKRRDPCHHRFDICDDQGNVLMDILFSEVLRPARRVIPASLILGKVHENLRRNRELRSEIREKFSQTQAIMENTRATLARSRAHA